MKLFSGPQIRNWDAMTLQIQNVDSTELMDRASGVFAHWISEKAYSRHQHEGRRTIILAGPGNNGGDALAIARFLSADNIPITVIRAMTSQTNFSKDHLIQLEELPRCVEVIPVLLDNTPIMFPEFQSTDIIIDGLFGSGLSRPLEGGWAELIKHINRSEATIYSIDIPSGIDADGSISGPAIQANHTLSFQIPKRSFFMPENEITCGAWEVMSIGLDERFEEITDSDHILMDMELAAKIIRRRTKFSHKGTYGHGLLICGSSGKIGAAILAGKGALRSGIGLLTVAIPGRGEIIMQTALPEAMVICDPHDYHWSTPISEERFDAIGIGCGIGTYDLSQKVLNAQIESSEKPMVLDADALNMIAQGGYSESLPTGTILTPHPGEFKRLFGDFPNSRQRWDFMRDYSAHTGQIIILKGAHTVISSPDGTIYINSTGNPGMATAGSGDVLTGIITGLLAQNYLPEQAAILGVFIHGLAGDLAAADMGMESIIASDLINHLGKAFQQVHLYEESL